MTATPEATPVVETPPVPAQEPEKPVVEEEKKDVEEAAPVEVQASEPTPKEPEAEAVAEKEAPPTASVEPSLPSFKEDSYFVSDLKEAEKKALQDFFVKVEEAAKCNEFVLPPPPPPPPVVEVKKEVEVEVKKEAEAEACAVTETVTEVVTAVEAKSETLEGLIKQEVEEKSVEVKEESAAVCEAEASTDPVIEAPKEVEVEAPKEVEAEAPKDAEEPKCEAVAEEPKKEEEPAVVTETAAEATEAAPAEAAPAEEPVVVEKEVIPAEDVFLWGVPLEHSKGDPRTQVILLKFLRAREFKLPAAFKMLKNTVLWRKKFKADTILEEDFGTDYDCIASNYGKDKDGHPVCYNNFSAFADKELYQKVFGDAAKVENFLRWRVQLLEKGIKLLDFNPGGINALVQVTDVAHCSFLPGLLKFTMKALNLLQDNYPELVVKHVILNTPWHFNALFALYSPFMTARTKSKFVLAKPGKTAESLFKYISPDNVPIQYGGLSKPDDTDFDGKVAPVNELLVKPLCKETIEIDLIKDTTVTWDLTVVGADFTYGAEFVPEAEGSYTTLIAKTKKVVTLEEPIRTTYKATENGKINVIIDNSHSKKKKLAVYRYVVSSST